MGIPYSKQINAAFDQVTPLVASTTELLQTTRNISYMLATIQILTAILQFCTVMALIALLITVNPDLDKERKALVTPILKYVASCFMPGSEGRWYLKFIGKFVFCLWLCGCAAAAYYVYKDGGLRSGVEVDVPINVDSGTGEDVVALKKGESQQ